MSTAKSTRVKTSTWSSQAAARLLRMVPGAQSIPEAIERIVDDALQGVATAPTNLEALCAKLGVEASESQEIVGLGLLTLEAGRFRIYYSDGLRKTRMRFTIAHEIGHLLMLRSGKWAPTSGRELERICDLFASEILMPTKVFREQAASVDSLQGILRLSSVFQASLSSTAIRFGSLRKAVLFHVDNNHVKWSSGFIRSGHTDELPESLKRVISEAPAQGTLPSRIFVTVRDEIRHYEVESMRLGGDFQALYFLRRLALPAREAAAG